MCWLHIQNINLGVVYIDFDKMVDVIRLVMQRGPAYGYNLNLKKSIYLMSPSTQRLSSDELHRRIRLLIDLGVPAQNIKIHPDCELGVSSALVDKRKAEWGFKILGAYVGTDEFVMNALQQKMESIRKITEALLLYPNVQARRYLHM